jgi:hypothetical protein
LDIGFIDHFRRQLVITLTAPSLISTLYKSLPTCTVFTSSFLVTASNSDYSTASRLCPLSAAAPFQLNYFLHILPYRNDLHRRHHLHEYLFCRMSIRCRGNVFLRSRYIETARYNCLSRGRYIVTAVHATIFIVFFAETTLFPPDGIAVENSMFRHVCADGSTRLTCKFTLSA